MRKRVFKNIDEHCYDLGYLLYEINPGDFRHICEWLSTAASIQQVSLDVFKFDDQPMMCGNAYRYEVKREALLTSHVSKLTQFMFVWSALEALVDFLDLPNHPRLRGKINSACHYIDSCFTKRATLASYKEIFHHLCAAASRSAAHQEIMENMKVGSHSGIDSLGLSVVYKLRNAFAHGSLAFPQLDGNHEPESLDIEVIELATRTVLLSIQMMLIARYLGTGIKIVISIEDDQKESPLEDWIQTLHFKNKNDPSIEILN